MGTEINSRQIKDDGVKRDDLNTSEAGQAVVTKIVAGTGVTLDSTGVDAGTGDVTINASGGGGGGGMSHIGTVTGGSASVGASSTAENTMSPTWTGSNTISADSLAVGDAIHIKAGGKIRLDQGSGAWRLRVKMGGTELAHFYIASSTYVHQAWFVDVMICVRSIGSSGSFAVNGMCVTEKNHAYTGIHASTGINGMIFPTINTTTNQDITFTAQYTASDPHHATTVETASIVHQTA